MPTLTVEMTLTHGDTTSETSVPCRESFNYSIEYTEEATKRLRVAADVTDQEVLLDSVNAPKFIFIESLETAVTVKLADGTAADIAPTAVAADDGWVMIAHPTGQTIDRVLISTPASPVEGALVRILAFE